MKRELEKFKKILNLNTDNYKPHLKSVQQSAEKFVIELHKLGVIDDDLLKHTIGVKFYEGKGYQKIPGSFAKYFNCEKPGYAYPLFKTPKLDPDKLIEASIFELKRCHLLIMLLKVRIKLVEKWCTSTVFSVAVVNVNLRCPLNRTLNPNP